MWYKWGRQVMQGGKDICYYWEGHVTGDNHFILDVPHLLHRVVIFILHLSNFEKKNCDRILPDIDIQSIGYFLNSLLHCESANKNVVTILLFFNSFNFILSSLLFFTLHLSNFDKKKFDKSLFNINISSIGHFSTACCILKVWAKMLWPFYWFFIFFLYFIFFLSFSYLRFIKFC